MYIQIICKKLNARRTSHHESSDPAKNTARCINDKNGPFPKLTVKTLANE